MGLRNVLGELLDDNLRGGAVRNCSAFRVTAEVQTLELWNPPGGLALLVKLRPLLGERLLSRSSMMERLRDLERGVMDALRSRIGVRDLLRV